MIIDCRLSGISLEVEWGTRRTTWMRRKKNGEHAAAQRYHIHIHSPLGFFDCDAACAALWSKNCSMCGLLEILLSTAYRCCWTGSFPTHCNLEPPSTCRSRGSMSQRMGPGRTLLCCTPALRPTTPSRMSVAGSALIPSAPLTCPPLRSRSMTSAWATRGATFASTPPTRVATSKASCTLSCSVGTWHLPGCSQTGCGGPGERISVKFCRHLGMYKCVGCQKMFKSGRVWKS